MAARGLSAARLYNGPLAWWISKHIRSRVSRKFFASSLQLILNKKVISSEIDHRSRRTVSYLQKHGKAILLRHFWLNWPVDIIRWNPCSIYSDGYVNTFSRYRHDFFENSVIKSTGIYKIHINCISFSAVYKWNWKSDWKFATVEITFNGEE